MRFLIITAVVSATVAMNSARAEDLARGSWQPMTFHDLLTPSATDPLQTLVWPDVIRSANSYVTRELKRPLNGKNALITALSSTYQQGSRTIIVSIVATRGCDHGANEKGADIEASTCPLRIVTIEDGRVISAKTETGCYADHADPALPAKNRDDNSYTRFDPASGMIAVRTNVGGRDVPRCNQTFSVN